MNVTLNSSLPVSQQKTMSTSPAPVSQEVAPSSTVNEDTVTLSSGVKEEPVTYSPIKQSTEIKPMTGGGTTQPPDEPESDTK